jgi:hypothetical protein
VWWLLADALGSTHNPLLGALPLLGGAGAALSPQPPHYRQFNRAVQRELAAGRWVVLARQVPWAQQAAVVALLRQNSVGWCAMPAPWHTL